MVTNHETVLDLYFDEAGFTGNDLNNPEQTHFCYASVATSEKEAEEKINELKEKYKIQMPEIKGMKLIKSNNGKRFLFELISYYSNRMIISVSEKRFALCAKFFEYVFEPILANKNSIFYDLNFHMFISNIIYYFTYNDQGAKQLLIDFQNFMRDKDNTNFNKSIDMYEKSEPVIQNIIDFCRYNEKEIVEEYEFLKGEGFEKWILDLTKSVLFGILAKWGERRLPLRAFCDNAKPLLSNTEIFEAMLNREDIHYIKMGDKTFPLTFNLSEPLILLDSKNSHALQVADCIASTFSYIFSKKGENDEFYQQIISLLNHSNSYSSVLPDYQYVRLDKFETQRNVLLLQELVERSKKNIDLLKNIEQYINFISNFLIISPLR